MGRRPEAGIDDDRHGRFLDRDPDRLQQLEAAPRADRCRERHDRRAARLLEPAGEHRVGHDVGQDGKALRRPGSRRRAASPPDRAGGSADPGITSSLIQSGRPPARARRATRTASSAVSAPDVFGRSRTSSGRKLVMSLPGVQVDYAARRRSPSRSLMRAPPSRIVSNDVVLARPVIRRDRNDTARDHEWIVAVSSRSLRWHDPDQVRRSQPRGHLSAPVRDSRFGQGSNQRPLPAANEPRPVPWAGQDRPLGRPFRAGATDEGSVQRPRNSGSRFSENAAIPSF